MRGEFIRAWSYMWPEVWHRLISHQEAGKAILCEVYEAIELLPARLPEGQQRPTLFKSPEEEERDIVLRNDADAAAEFFQGLSGRRFMSELHIVNAIERIAAAIEDAYPQTVVDRFRSLIKGFVKRHGLHYRMVHPLSFRPCAEGIFCGLFRQVKEMGKEDQHFGQLLSECEEALDDLRDRPTEARVKSCIGKQINVAEALAGKHIEAHGIQVTQNRNGRQVVVDRPALSAMSHVLGTWPHNEVKNALRRYYDFACDYPGIRHRGTPRNALRPLALQDAVAGLVLLMGFAAYLTDSFDHGQVYGM